MECIKEEITHFEHLLPSDNDSICSTVIKTIEGILEDNGNNG